MKRILTILIWSAISAAFIGPGTVTTAGKAGAGFGLSLLWTLVFSTLACLVLQEASARLTIASGMPLARAIGATCKGRGASRFVPAIVVGAVVLGCAAYQAGNILGATAGAALKVEFSPRWITLLTGLLAAAVLFAGTAKAVARILGLVVAFMGVAFLVCAVRLGPEPGALLKGCLVPSLPEKSGMIALGLVGTTVVPYNLFLGSGLARGQTLSEARWGLAVAIPLGGVISIGIVVAGTAAKGEFSYEALAGALSGRLGGWAEYLFAFGLFTAGFSSAVTAPLAAALSIRGALAEEKESRWNDRSWRYRGLWGSVLVLGLAFGLADVKPIPAIILAQALNGVLLPLVALFLWVAVNDGKLMGKENLCGPFANAFMGFCVLVTFVLGSRGLLGAACRILGADDLDENLLLKVAGVVALILALPVGMWLRRKRREGAR